VTYLPDHNKQRVSIQAWARKQKETQLSTYLGTRVFPHPKAEGQVLELHKKIGDEFARIDPLPNGREDRFAHIKDFDPDVIINGWCATILDTTPVDGGMLVTLKVNPSLVSKHYPTIHSTDYWIERYTYSPQTKKLFFEGAAEDPTLTHKFILID
jgi:hypothetical protein